MVIAFSKVLFCTSLAEFKEDPLFTALRLDDTHRQSGKLMAEQRILLLTDWRLNARYRQSIYCKNITLVHVLIPPMTPRFPLRLPLEQPRDDAGLICTTIPSGRP